MVPALCCTLPLSNGDEAGKHAGKDPANTNSPGWYLRGRRGRKKNSLCSPGELPFLIVSLLTEQ